MKFDYNMVVAMKYSFSFSKKDLKKILNHVFNYLIVCGEDFDKSTEFHKKKIIKDLDYSNMFSFKNIGFGIVFDFREDMYCLGEECDNTKCMGIGISIIELSPFLFLTKKEKIDFNNFLKHFKIFDETILQKPDHKNFVEPIFEHKNNDFLLNLDEKAISKTGGGYDIMMGINDDLYQDFFKTTLHFKCDEKKLEKVIQNFFKNFKILSTYDFGTFEKIRIPKNFLKSSMRINFKFNKLPIYVELYKYDKERDYKGLEIDVSIVFGFSFERDIREANEDRKKLFNKHFKKFKKLSNDIKFRQRHNCEDYFKKTLFNENGFKLKKR